MTRPDRHETQITMFRLHLPLGDRDVVHGLPFLDVARFSAVVLVPWNIAVTTFADRFRQLKKEQGLQRPTQEREGTTTAGLHRYRPTCSLDCRVRSSVWEPACLLCVCAFNFSV